jgi:glycosyltransferase involved in cell wall biosynthesis
LVNVGRQEFQKGQAYLVEAMAELATLRPRAVLLVAGRQGNQSAHLNRLVATRKSGDRVRFLGYREDIPNLLASADVFVFPSLYEGLGGALIEAMAAGLPIVASNLRATREILEPGRNAILVPPESPSHLAAAVLRLLNEDKMRVEFGARSRSLFEQRFTLEGSVGRMVAMYQKVIE